MSHDPSANCTANLTELGNPRPQASYAAMTIQAAWRGVRLRFTLSSRAGEGNPLGERVLRERFVCDQSEGGSRAWLKDLRHYWTHLYTDGRKCFWTGWRGRLVPPQADKKRRRRQHGL